GGPPVMPGARATGAGSFSVATGGLAPPAGGGSAPGFGGAAPVTGTQAARPNRAAASATAGHWRNRRSRYALIESLNVGIATPGANLPRDYRVWDSPSNA